MGGFLSNGVTVNLLNEYGWLGRMGSAIGGDRVAVRGHGQTGRTRGEGFSGDRIGHASGEDGTLHQATWEERPKGLGMYGTRVASWTWPIG